MNKREKGNSVFITERELADRWNKSVDALRTTRCKKPELMPNWFKLGGAVRYRLSDIEEYERQGAQGTAA